MNNEIFLSLLNWLYIIKKKSNVFVEYVFYFTLKRPVGVSNCRCVDLSAFRPVGMSTIHVNKPVYDS